MPPPSVEPFDAAIILGAALAPDGGPSPALHRRVMGGVELMRQGRARALVMTGGATTSATPEAWVMRDLAMAEGAEMVEVEDQSLNTIQNARLCLPIIRERGWTRLAVVTDSYHLPRALYVFRRFGLPATGIPVRPDRPGKEWWLAHIREAGALPWTFLRVERRLFLRK